MGEADIVVGVQDEIVGEADVVVGYKLKSWARRTTEMIRFTGYNVTLTNFLLNINNYSHLFTYIDQRVSTFVRIILFIVLIHNFFILSSCLNKYFLVFDQTVQVSF